MFKTQKARGLSVGWVLSTQAAYGYSVPTVHGVFPHIEEGKIKLLFDRQNGPPVFARPCPVTPRHGFVESRVVGTYDEFVNVVKETKEHDPDGEVILMDRLSGKYSAIMTATGVAWGRSNDGVTSGKGEQRNIPCPAGTFDAKFLEYLGKKKTDDCGVYVELVEHDGQVYIVQMRLGPKQPDSRLKRVVQGQQVRISGIITAPETVGDDLVAWDALLKNTHVYSSKTYLVHLPGQSMSSHFVVQALANGYNVSIEAECPVKPGEILTPLAGDALPLSARDYRYMAKCFKADQETIFWDYPRDVLLTVATLHALPYWGSERHLLRLRVRGALLAARYGLAACLGEARHRPGHYGDKDCSVPWKVLLKEPDATKDRRPTRGYVFIRAFETPWKLGASLAEAAAKDMILPGSDSVLKHLASGGKVMDHSTKTSFMGMRWEWAAIQVHDLIVAIDRFVADPNETNWLVILGKYNAIINASHNGGYLLNKWCSPALIDGAATAPSIALGFRQVMGIVWGEKEAKPEKSLIMPIETFDPQAGSNYTCIWVSDEDTKAVAFIANEVLDAVYGDSKPDCQCAECIDWPNVFKKSMSLGKTIYASPRLGDYYNGPGSDDTEDEDNG